MTGYYDRSGQPISMAEWLEKLEDLSYKLLDRTSLTGGGFVSTVWLGLDHGYVLGGPPVIFETMVFDAPGIDGAQYRYTTEAEAHAGHATVVDLCERSFRRVLPQAVDNSVDKSRGES
jgi:hypothetical protein